MFGPLVPWRTHHPKTWGREEHDLEKLMERIFEPTDGWLLSSEFSPRVNVAETESSYEITMDLPGISPRELTVEVRDNSLMVSGERREEKEEKGKTFHHMERRYGKFNRSVPLELPVDREKVDTKYCEGVLTINVPKMPGAAAKRVEVKT